MGEAELNKQSGKLIVHSVFFFYGNAASKDLSVQIAEDISNHWNEPNAKIKIKGTWFDVRFHIEGYYEPGLLPETVWYNTDPRNNYFRIEEFSMSHISFVDGLNCNTGYFKLDNLFNNSTTAAHEYGHSLGLEHPKELDIRGKGQPGIMYPRGTICDPEFQYDTNALPLQPGGTLNPYARKVLQSDISGLKLHRLSFSKKGFSMVGGFSSIYHQKHLPSA
ncbi:MAG: peptidase M10 [Bacteroidetes bacterium]|nr:peptidase M10 [Bacteroidota bacterium]MBS1974489.1 peptidase M10 [Bacteroidota bacterium]